MCPAQPAETVVAAKESVKQPHIGQNRWLGTLFVLWGPIVVGLQGCPRAAVSVAQSAAAHLPASDVQGDFQVGIRLLAAGPSLQQLPHDGQVAGASGHMQGCVSVPCLLLVRQRWVVCEYALDLLRVPCLDGLQELGQGAGHLCDVALEGAFSQRERPSPG